MNRRRRFQFTLRSLLAVVGFAAVAVTLYAWYDDYHARNSRLSWESYSQQALDAHLRKGRTVLVICDPQPPYFGPFDESSVEWDPDDYADGELRYAVRANGTVLMVAIVREATDHPELIRQAPSGSQLPVALIYRPNGGLASVFVLDIAAENAVGDFRPRITRELTRQGR